MSPPPPRPALAASLVGQARSPRRTSPAVEALALVLSIAVVACRGTPATRSGNNVERTALVAQHCPGLDLEAEPLDPTNARVFVEIVEVSRRDLPDPIGHWLDENAVKIRSSANLVAFPGVPTSVPWAQCVDAACADIERSVRVTAQLPASTLQPIELAVQIEETSGEGAAPKNLLDTQVRAIHQEPVVLPSPPVLGTGTLVLTAYLLRRFDDLHRVMECKVQHAERENQSAPQ